MIGNLESLDVILRENLLRIPDYQRGYSWEEKEVKDFWEDLELILGNRNHYAGVLTFEQVDKNTYEQWKTDNWLINERRINPYYVVDGQQRLTTAVILLITILKISKNKFPDKMLDTNRTIESIYSDYIAQEKDYNKTYKFLYDYENDSLGYYIQNILEERLPEHSNLTVQNNEYSNNLKCAKEFFEKKCNDLEYDELNNLFKKLLYNLVFNKYIIDKELDIFVTFETMNNRGKPLSKLELLKNRLIYLTMLINSNDSAKSNLRTQINECWKKLYRELGKAKINNDDSVLFGGLRFRNSDDSFLNAQIQEYKPLREFIKKNNIRVRSSSPFGEINILLEQYFTAKNVIDGTIKINQIRQYIDDVGRKITLWIGLNEPFEYKELDFEERQLLNGIKNLLLRKHNGTNLLFDVYFSVDSIERLIFKLYSSSCDIQKRLDILQQIETGLLIRLFLSNLKYKVSHNKFLSFEGLREFMELFEREIEDYSEFLIELKRVLNKLKQAFVNGIYFKNTKVDTFLFYKNNKSVAKYILFDFEANLIKVSKDPEAQMEIKRLYSNYEGDVYNIEHIYPKAGQNSYWNRQFGSKNDKEKNCYKHCLANLVLIGKKKNSYLGNESYPEKRKEGDCCYETGILSERKLAKDFEDWTPDTILLRAERFKKYLNERWNINFTNKEVFDRFIGLKQ